MKLKNLVLLIHLVNSLQLREQSSWPFVSSRFWQGGSLQERYVRMELPF